MARSLAFSGDSGWTDDLIGISAGADLFLCECTYFDSNHLDFHLNYPTIERNRGRFTAKRMILTHLGREVLERRERRRDGDGRRFDENNCLTGCCESPRGGVLCRALGLAMLVGGWPSPACRSFAWSRAARGDPP